MEIFRRELMIFVIIVEENYGYKRFNRMTWPNLFSLYINTLDLFSS